MVEKATSEIVDNDNLDQIDEGSAADTLHPGAGSGGTETKSEMLATFTSLLAQLGKEDLSKIFNDVQAQFGPNRAPGAEDKSAAIRASVDMKPSAAVGKGAWREDIDDMFGGEELSEDFREKATTVFEAAVTARMNLETARLEEEFETAQAEMQEQFDNSLQEQVSAMFEDVSGKLDQYLEYVIEQWMEENKLAIENSLRAEIAENFIQSLHNTFAEHYIRVPDDKLDLVAEMRAELDELKTRLNEEIDQKLELQAVIDEATKESTLDGVSEGLAATQAEKLRTLAEGIEFTDAETYKRKLEIVKENYFSGKKAPASTGLITEEIDGVDDTQADVAVPAHMQKYVAAISKSVK